MSSSHNRPHTFTFAIAMGQLIAIAAIGVTACDDANSPAISQPTYEILGNESTLPEAVARTRQAMLSAARSGDLAALNRVLQTSELKPVLASEPVKDPVAHWKAASVDGEGRSVLAAMVNVLEADGVRVSGGGADESYVWPAFAELPLDRLTPAQTVEFYRLGDARAIKQMIANKAYTYYRVSIGKDGTWHAFARKPQPK